MILLIDYSCWDREWLIYDVSLRSVGIQLKFISRKMIHTAAWILFHFLLLLLPSLQQQYVRVFVCVLVCVINILSLFSRDPSKCCFAFAQFGHTNSLRCHLLLLLLLLWSFFLYSYVIIYFHMQAFAYVICYTRMSIHTSTYLHWHDCYFFFWATTTKFVDIQLLQYHIYIDTLRE